MSLAIGLGVGGCEEGGRGSRDYVSCLDYALSVQGPLYIGCERNKELEKLRELEVGIIGAQNGEGAQSEYPRKLIINARVGELEEL